jgi:hypothetical protein
MRFIGSTDANSIRRVAARFAAAWHRGGDRGYQFYLSRHVHQVVATDIYVAAGASADVAPSGFLVEPRPFTGDNLCDPHRILPLRQAARARDLPDDGVRWGVFVRLNRAFRLTCRQCRLRDRPCAKARRYRNNCNRVQSRLTAWWGWLGSFRYSFFAGEVEALNRRSERVGAGR